VKIPLRIRRHALTVSRGPVLLYVRDGFPLHSTGHYGERVLRPLKRTSLFLDFAKTCTLPEYRF